MYMFANNQNYYDKDDYDLQKNLSLIFQEILIGNMVKCTEKLKLIIV